ncbi:helitron helicase-like domain-containing protein [Tanacetum coccineum]
MLVIATVHHHIQSAQSQHQSPSHQDNRFRPSTMEGGSFRSKLDKECNVRSLVGTLLNVPGKTKDGMHARLDLAELGIKQELFARQEEDKTTLPPAGYTLTNAKKDIFCETLSNIRVIKGHVRNRNRPEGCIAEETIAEEIIEFFSEYHKSMETIGIPPDKHETDENEEGKPLSAGKSSEVSAELFQKAHLYVIQNTDEIVPYIERHKQVLKTENLGKRIAFLENEHSKSFAKWLRKEVERELAISKDSVSETVRWISYGPRATIVKYEAYNINGYTFHTKSNDGIVYQNSGVSVEAVDLYISKDIATTKKAFYFEVLQEIWVLDYRFRQIPLFKCDWVNHKAGGVKHDPNLGYTLVDLNSLGHKDDPFILASQA